MNLKKTLTLILTVICAAAIAVTFWAKYSVFDKSVLLSTDSVVFVIPKNSTITQIAGILRASGFNISDFEFKLTSKWYGLDSKIRYGEFRYYKDGITRARELIEFLTTNGTLTSNVTIPEGSRITEIAGILKNVLGIDSVLFVDNTKDTLLLKKYGLQAESFEGYLYPETYNFNKNDSFDQIIGKMYGTFRSRTAELKNMIDSSGYSEHEIVTLASIIQGEVMVYGEVNDISAVYNNRLKKGILLQADPTVQYIFGKPKRLFFKDIEIDNPYNTYIYKGLPPGPINNPSVKAIRAALEPSDKKYLYMVAKGDGSHYFNFTLEDHLKDKAKLDELRKSLKRKKKK